MPSLTPSSPPLLVALGPTAVGKTALALELAAAFTGEIVSADSRQIYRYMDIGTAKPTPAERACVPHHLIDIVDPDAEYSLALYQRDARAAIAAIHEAGKLPILVGGTGLYIRAVVDGLDIPTHPPDWELRAELEAQAARDGADTLHAQLQVLDPLAAGRIDPANVRRVIRALEVCLLSGQPFSAQQRRQELSPYSLLLLGLTADRNLLYARSDQRVDRMLAAGLLDEVQGLLDRGYTPALPALSSLGYRQCIAYLRGEMTLPAALKQFKRDTRNYIRRQLTWFRPDSRITWLDQSQRLALPEALTLVKRWLTDIPK